MINAEDTTVLFIDIQEKMMPAIHNRETVEGKACVLARAARLLKLEVLVTRQYPKRLGDTVPALKEVLI